MSYSNSFPQQRPTLNLDFANSGKLDSRISFSRADTPPTYAAPSAVHYWSNEKHKSSENLVTQSDGSDWIFSSADYTETASQNGPDGSTNATKYTEKANGNTDYEIRSNNFTPIANKEITYSVWFKQTSGSRNYQQLRVGGIGTNQAFVTFNLTNGTVDQTGGTLGVSASVNDGPTGWYQCVMKFTPTTTTALSIYIYAAAASGGELPQVTGDTGNSFTMFGAQASTTGETVANATSGQIHREYSSTLKSVSNAGDPRFEYDPTDGQSVGTAKGLLVESQSTSLVTYSEDSTQWSKAFSAFQANAGVAPNGTTTATLWTPDTSTNPHYASNGTFATTSGTTYTGSVFLKGVNTTRAQVTFGGGGFAGGYVNFSLTGDGSVLTEQAGATGTISSCGNGFYRVTITETADVTTTTTGVTLGLISSDTEARLQTSTPNGYDGLLVTGFQIETGSHASSYLKSNSGSTTTRAADSCSVDSATLFDNGDTTVMCDVTVPTDTGTVSGGTSSRFFRLENSSAPSTGENYEVYRTASGQIVAEADAGGANVASYYVANSSPAGNYKLAVRYGSDSKAYLNGAAGVSSDSAMPNPSGLDTLRIGSYSNTGGILNGHIGRLSLYSVALSNEELQSLTS